MVDSELHSSHTADTLFTSCQAWTGMSSTYCNNAAFPGSKFLFKIFQNQKELRQRPKRGQNSGPIMGFLDALTLNGLKIRLRLTAPYTVHVLNDIAQIRIMKLSRES